MTHRILWGQQGDRSPARILVDHVWAETPHRSWQQLNQRMQDAVALAIKAGLKFAKDDIEGFHDRMRGGFWFGDCEWMHKLAVDFANASAAVSFEAWMERKPFFLNGRRLYVGAQVEPQFLGGRSDKKSGMVTSFGNDDSVVVCVYKTDPWRRKGEPAYKPGGAPLRKIRLTLDAVRAMEKERLAALRRAKAETGSDAMNGAQRVP